MKKTNYQLQRMYILKYRKAKKELLKKRHIDTPISKML